MEVRGRKKILDFIASGDAKAKRLFPAWLQDMENSEWKLPMDIKRRHATADILPGNRVVFNIGGNDYRLIACIDFERQVVFIRWVGTHAEYNKIDAKRI